MAGRSRKGASGGCVARDVFMAVCRSCSRCLLMRLTESNFQTHPVLLVKGRRSLYEEYLHFGNRIDDRLIHSRSGDSMD